MRYENEHTEYKSQLTDEIYKEVVAFANTGRRRDLHRR